MNLSDEDRILAENLYVFKGCGSNRLVGKFSIKVGTAGTEQTFKRAA